MPLNQAPGRKSGSAADLSDGKINLPGMVSGSMKHKHTKRKTMEAADAADWIHGNREER